MPLSFELPKDLLVHIFSLSDYGSEENTFDWDRAPEVRGQPILTPKDRARCQAVCRNWRAWLNPGALPLEMATVSARNSGVHAECCGDATRHWHLTRLGMHHHPAAAQWLGSSRAGIRCLALDVCLGTEADQAGTESLEALQTALLHIQPGALKELHLLMGSTSSLLETFWPTLPRFTELRLLHICAGRDWSLSHSLLAGLPCLEDLEIVFADQVVLVGSGTLLPRLTRLECSEADRLELAAELPSLRKLVVSEIESVVLSSATLRLPALTKLEAANCSLRVDWETMPSLQHMMPPVNGFLEPVGDPAGFGTLTHLTSLEFRWVPDIMALTYVQLLRHARALRSLKLGVGCRDEAERFVPSVLLAAAAVGARQLTHLACYAGADDNAESAGLVVPHLAPFKQLEELQLEWEAVGSLTLSQLDLLEGLPNLQKLVLDERYVVDETPEILMKRKRQLEMLKRALGGRVQVEDRSTELHLLPTTELEVLLSEYLQLAA